MLPFESVSSGNYVRPQSHSCVEPLESRQLFSAAGVTTTLIEFHPSSGVNVQYFTQYHAIRFDQAPSAVQNGLTALAAAKNAPAPAEDQKIILGNANGIETYSFIKGPARFKRPDPEFTVDVNGDSVASTTKSTTTFGTISNSAVTDEFDAIAAGLNVSAPASTDGIIVTTLPTGKVIYSRKFQGAGAPKGVRISVDDTGLPVGNEIGGTSKVPFSALSSVIQDGLNNNAPAGASAINPSSNQIVTVRTLNGITTFSARFVANGVKTTVTVDSTGAVVTLPSQSTSVFSNIPLAARDEIQQLASDNGFGGTINSSHAVTVYDEANGTLIYGINISMHKSGGMYSFDLWVDQDGNPTVRSTDGEIGIVHLTGGGTAIANHKISGSMIIEI